MFNFPRALGVGGTSKASNVAKGGLFGNSAPEKMQNVGNAMSSATSMFGNKGRSQAPNAMGGSPYMPSFTPNVDSGSTFNPPSQQITSGGFNMHGLSKQPPSENLGNLGGFSFPGMGSGQMAQRWGMWNPMAMPVSGENIGLRNLQGEEVQLPRLSSGGFNFPNMGIRF